MPKRSVTLTDNETTGGENSIDDPLFPTFLVCQNERLGLLVYYISGKTLFNPRSIVWAPAGVSLANTNTVLVPFGTQI